MCCSPVSKRDIYSESRATILHLAVLAIDHLLSMPKPPALFPGHCIWSSMFEKAALSFSAFLISSALT